VNALKAADEIEHLILRDFRILLLQTDGLHGERGEIKWKQGERDRGLGFRLIIR